MDSDSWGNDNHRVGFHETIVAKMFLIWCKLAPKKKIENFSRVRKLNLIYIWIHLIFLLYQNSSSSGVLITLNFAYDFFNYRGTKLARIPSHNCSGSIFIIRVNASGGYEIQRMYKTTEHFITIFHLLLYEIINHVAHLSWVWNQGRWRWIIITSQPLSILTYNLKYTECLTWRKEISLSMNFYKSQ